MERPSTSWRFGISSKTTTTDFQRAARVSETARSRVIVEMQYRAGIAWVKFIGAHSQYAFGPADPVEAIKFRMDQQGLTPRDLERYIGPSGRVSEVLNRKRPLSLRMVKQLHDGLRIPYESLLAGVA